MVVGDAGEGCCSHWRRDRGHKSGGKAGSIHDGYGARKGAVTWLSFDQPVGGHVYSELWYGHIATVDFAIW